MRDCNVVSNGFEEESPDNGIKCIYKDVVIIGNGPSGMTLSYLLSGHSPYYNRKAHPDPMLSARLIECTQKSLLHQDLAFLSQGIEGRSKNPVSLLIDAMTHPGADMGLEWPSLLTWKKTNKCLDHIVLGKGQPGGTWQGIADNVLTISPGRWMTLPGLEFNEYKEGRAPASSVAKYYTEYVHKHGLNAHMASNTTVTMIQPLTCKTRRRARWRVWVNDASGSTMSYECRHLVLATGASDKAGCLGVPGESLPYVNHDLKGLEEHLIREETEISKRCRESKVFSSVDNIQNVALDDTLWSSANSKIRILPRKDKVLLKTKSNSSLLSSESSSNSSSADNVLKSTDNIPKRLNDTEVDLKKFQDRDQIHNINDAFYNSMIRDKHNHELLKNINKYKQMSNAFHSDVKTEENIFEISDSFWLTNDIPGDVGLGKRERHLSLNELRTKDQEALRSSLLCNSEKTTENVQKSPVLVVGAGLSAADAILTARRRGYPVVHAFRRTPVPAPLPAVMYPEYHEVYQLMQDLISHPDYTALPGFQVTEFSEDNFVHLCDSTGNKQTLKVFTVAVLIGSQPDLSFLPRKLRNLGIDANKPVDCKVNPINIEPFSYKCVRAPPGLYALGPLVGDNFVRFLQGGAVAIASQIFKESNLQPGIN